MTAECCRRSVHLLGCNRLEVVKTLPDSFTQAKGMIGSVKDPMSALCGNALSLWTLLMKLGIRTSLRLFGPLGHCGLVHTKQCLVPLEYWKMLLRDIFKVKHVTADCAQ